jgi:hypothetical protein
MPDDQKYITSHILGKAELRLSGGGEEPQAIYHSTTNTSKKYRIENQLIDHRITQLSHGRDQDDVG